VIVDRESFTDLTVHLKLATDAVLETARHIAALSSGARVPEERCAAALDQLMAMALEMVAIESILRALLEANDAEQQSPPILSGGKCEPVLS
jgi:hypothetical protein